MTFEHDLDPIIIQYTRREAIADGVLKDVSETSEWHEAGFKFPVAMTERVWKECVEVPPNVPDQDWHGRLWDILWMLKCAIRLSRNGDNLLFFVVHVRNDNRQGIPPAVKLKCHCGPGDEGEPVLTIMFPDED
jgi:hypothetical protein